MKCWSATVTFMDGQTVTVNYPADATDPNLAALRAAAKELNVPGFSQAPKSIVHHRDGEPKEVP